MRPPPLRPSPSCSAPLAILALALAMPLAAETATPVPAPAAAAAAASLPRGYHIGNSLTYGVVSFPDFTAYLGDPGQPYVYGYHVLWGASLSQIVQKQDTPSTMAKAFGPYPVALATGSWDIVTLQPSFAVMEGPQGDLAQASGLITLAAAHAPNVQIYIYETWPTVGDKAPPGTYARMWDRTYSPGAWDHVLYSHDYCSRLVLALRDEHLTAKPILLLPVGAVLSALDAKAHAGLVPGVAAVETLYRDGTHLGTIGNFVAMCTWRCVLRRQNPQGINEALLPPEITPALARIVEQTVWETVAALPLAGIAPPRDAAGAGSH